MKKLEFSKKIMVFSGAVTIIVTAFTLFMVYKTENLEPLVYLIPSAFGSYGAGEAFYYAKAKVENQIKLRKKYGSEVFNDAKGDS